jgi:hypothetical protein
MKIQPSLGYAHLLERNARVTLPPPAGHSVTERAAQEPAPEKQVKVQKEGPSPSLPMLGAHIDIRV